jgi:hypothetical protein
VPAALTGSLRGFLFATAALVLLAAAAQALEAAKFDRFWRTRDLQALAELGNAENLSAGALGLVALLSLVVGPLTIIWFYRAYRAVLDRGPAGPAWSPGWAIGGWFLPLGNLIIPRLVFGEIDRMSNPENGPPPIGGRWRDTASLAAAHWWWALFVGGSALFLTGAYISGTEIEVIAEFDAGRYRAGLWLSSVGLLTEAPAALVGARVFGTVGRRLEH